MHRSVPLGRPAPQALAPGEVMLHRRALEKIAPPSILVDEIHRAVHLSDSAGRYLKPAGGALTGDVVDLVRPELRFELRAALHHAFEGRQATLSMPILVRFNGAPRRVYLEVKPVSQDEGPPRHALVMFIEGEALTEAGAPPGVFYMNKIVVGPDAKGAVDIRASVAKNISRVSDALGRDEGDITVMILDRPRHEQLIKEVRATGARVRLIPDGDVMGAVAAGSDETGVDMLMGTGGAQPVLIAGGGIGGLATLCLNSGS